MNEIKKGWKKVKLGDIAKITSSKRVYLKDYVENGVPFFRGKEFIQIFNNKANNDILYIAEEKYLEIKNKFGVPQEGDILLTSVGTLGIPYLVKKGDEFYFKDGNLIWFRNINSDVNSKFFYYWIISSKGASALKSITIGASQQAFTIAGIKTLDLHLPPLSTQQKIASVLSKYDDLIENNNKRIKVLEETAQAIYEEWFVNYNFPGSESVKMVDSGNDDFGMVPEGWEVKKFGSFYNVKYGKTLPKTKIKDFGLYPVYGAGGIIGFYNKKNIDKKVSLITCRGNGSSTVWRTLEKDTFVTNNSFIVTSGNIDFPFILEHLYGCNLKSAVSGSAQPQLTINGVKDLLILIPKIEIINKYNSFVDNIFSESDILQKQNQNLKETRDLLIPRLVGGELDVENLDVK